MYLLTVVDSSVISVHSGGHDFQFDHFIAMESVQHICYRGTTWI